MANMRDIRRRIKSVKNTAQITRAMQMVAASKMKKAQDQALAGRSYADMLNRVLANLKGEAEDVSHPLMTQREEGRTLILLVTTDKGLCGGLNTNLIRKVIKEAPEDAMFVTVGSKGRRSMAKLSKELIADFEVNDPVPFVETKHVSGFVTKQFLEGKVNKVQVAFTNFVNTLTQTPWISTVLPLSAETLAEKKPYEGVGKGEIAATDTEGVSDYLFEPSKGDVFESLLPLYVNFQIYQMIVEARASEHSARMVAMKAATDNAKNMIDDLTLEYNKLRQAVITAELLEITSAAMALE